MRLRRLDLTRYGKFTGHGIDFGERASGTPDLHLVYGPNEAGKSTAFAAFLDLLFGIGGQSPYGFLHPYSTMQVGGRLEFADGTRAFTRIKKPQNSLLDGEGRPIAEGAIRVELGGIEREAYRTMFSLDDETLEKGGESILASKGDLGELLFSAGAGLADLSRKLIELRGEADAFYRYRARTGALADLKGHLAELKADKERFDTAASEYGRLIQLQDQAITLHEAAFAERARAQARIDAIRRQLAALPRLSALRTCRQRLAPLSGLPEVPPGWAEALPGLEREAIELGIQRASVAESIARLSAEIEGIAVDEAALALADSHAQLAGLRARDVTAEKDLPERRLQLRAADLATAGILVRLERPGEAEPRRLVLGASTIGRLRGLIEARSGLDAALASAATESTDARRALAEAQHALRQADGDRAEAAGPDRMTALAATVQSLRASGHAARLRLAERMRDAERAKLADRICALAPWQGSADDLLGMRCPAPATIHAWKADLENQRTAIARHDDAIERLTSEIRRLEAERDGLGGTTGIVGDQDAADVRNRRERAWATHRRDLDPGSADAFEAVLRQDDLVTAGRLGHTVERAKLHQTGLALVVAVADLTRATDLRAASRSAWQALRDAVAETVGAMAPSLPEAMPLAELEGWLARRETALAAREALAAAETELREAGTEMAQTLSRLQGALDAAGLPHDPAAGVEALLAAAQDAVDRDGGIRTLRTRIDERRRAVLLRERALEQAGEKERAWQAEWGATCRNCWLGEAGETPDLATVREILAAMPELGPALDKSAGLSDRIEKMEKDQQDFGAGIAAIAAALAIRAEPAPGPAFDRHASALDRQIEGRIRDARAHRDRRAETSQALERERARARSLAEAHAIHEERARAMTAHFGVAALSDVAASLTDVAARAELRVQAEAAEREILDALGTAGIDAAERELDAADRPALDAEIAALLARHHDLEARCQELYASRRAAEDRVEAIGGDSRAAAIEERRRTTLLEIEEGAARYLHLRAGTLATELGLRVYRERHRSAMMTRASDAFRTISRGAYTGLAAQPGRDGETLIALSRSGGSKDAQDLSKGTRFQLYLALRVAGYHEFVRARAPVPFIADDIMETFDDFRAEEAFRLFADMAQAGQVIYLTHHQHLCDIALRACPSVRIHALPAP